MQEADLQRASAPLLNSVHISTGEKPNTEPTERSNSPEVISSVIASAIRPSSTVKASVLEMFCGDRKSGLIAQKTTSSTTSRTNGPNSGLAIRRWMHEDVVPRPDFRAVESVFEARIERDGRSGRRGRCRRRTAA